MTRVLCASVLAACGGAATLPAQKPPHEANDGDPTSLLSSLAAAQGGLSALGGNGNREDGPTGIEVALEGTLRAVDVDKKSPLKLDGLLREWPARVPAGEMLSGRPASVSLGVNVLVDDAKLYVAAEVLDTKLARTAAHPEGEDHVSMVIAFPESRGSLSAYEIGLWPGKPGESAGVVRWKSGPLKGKSVAGAAIVEADQKGGYTFEAAIPWASFSEARTTRVGLRAAFHYHDASGVLGTGGGSVDSPGELAPLPTSAETAVVEGLLTPRGLAGTAPQIDVYADVAGDERKERISVFGHFFTICGPG